MDLTAFARRAVGVPFADRGRDWSGWDCWGLLVVAHREVLGVDLNSHAESYRSAKQHRRLLKIFQPELRDSWVEVAPARAMDGILLRIEDRPLHVGLMLDRRNFLHVDRGVETCVQETDGIEWRDRVLGFYRLRPQKPTAS